MAETVCVVIPVYNLSPNFYETISLKRCSAILSKYPFIFVAPSELDVSTYLKICDANSFEIERFDDSFFTNGLVGYNKLLLSQDFYNRFINYEFILIHQLDCFIFSDSLLSWCQKDYDYVGAPWLDAGWHKEVFLGLLNQILVRQSFARRQLTKLYWRIRQSQSLAVGNGGLSLRRVTKFLNATIHFRQQILDWGLNEDLFWSIYLPLNSYEMFIPSWREALGFSFDYKPDFSFRCSENRLPFGCHAWYREDTVYAGNLGFWGPIVSRFLPLEIDSLGGRHHQTT